jgi:uncharacterized membrane protein YbhN (UPF0104 family)
MHRLAALAPLLVLLGAGGAAAQFLPGQTTALLHHAEAAAPVPLALAAGCYALSLACAGAGWRALLRGCGARIALAEAAACYAAGSLANALLPARAGDALRVGLFARTLPQRSPRLLHVGGVVAGLGALRWTALAALAAAGAAGSTLAPVALPLAVALALAPLAVAAVLARRGSERARTLLAPLRGASWADRAEAAGAVVATVAGRVTAAALVAEAFALPHPLAAAVLVVPTLELAGVLPLLPANVGVAGGAAALAFHLQGASPEAALAAGLTLHALETATSVLAGAVAAASLARRSRRRPAAVVISLPGAAALSEAA